MKKSKLTIVVMLLLVTVLSLTACGSKKECDICGEVKSGKTTEILGEKVFICNDCRDEMNSIFN